MKILIIEDEAAVSQFLDQALTESGYKTLLASKAEEGFELLEREAPDLVLLDALLPESDGFAFLKRVRPRYDVPVLMLTALAGVDDRVRGLDAGADDYLAKPFRLEELLARVRALLRRSRTEVATIQCSDLIVDLINRRVTRGGRVIFLSSTEFSLLELLARHQGAPVPKSTMLERVWDDGQRDPNLVEVYVSYLRGKLERGGLPRLVHTVRGRGYVLTEAPEGDLGDFA